MDDEFALELDDDPLPTGLCAITNHAAATHGRSGVCIPAADRAAEQTPHAAPAVRSAGQSPPAKQRRLAECTADRASAAADTVAAVPANTIDLDMTAPANAAGLSALQRAAARSKATRRSPVASPLQARHHASTATSNTVPATDRGMQRQAIQQPSFRPAGATKPQEQMQEAQRRVLPHRLTTEGRVPGACHESARGGEGASLTERSQPERQHQQQQDEQQWVNSLHLHKDRPASNQHSQPAHTDVFGRPGVARLPAREASAVGSVSSQRDCSAADARAAPRLHQPQLQRHRPRRVVAATASEQVSDFSQMRVLRGHTLLLVCCPCRARLQS